MKRLYMPPKAHTYSERAGFHFSRHNFLEIMYILIHSQAWLWIFINRVPCFTFTILWHWGGGPYSSHSLPRSCLHKGTLTGKVRIHMQKGWGYIPVSWASPAWTWIGSLIPWEDHWNSWIMKIKITFKSPCKTSGVPSQYLLPYNGHPQGLVLFSEATKSTFLPMFVLSQLSSWTHYVALSSTPPISLPWLSQISYYLNSS